MFSSFVTSIKKLKDRFPGLYNFLTSFAKKYFGKFLGLYPRPLSNEVSAVKEVLYSAKWNMAYGKDLIHEKLEEDFARYLGVSNAVAVNTGGMGLQMSMRALGLKPGNEVLLQVDTCSATAMAVMNAGCTPIFSDISDHSFMLSRSGINEAMGNETKAIIATHMWGNNEDMAVISEMSKEKNIFVIEDTCLALGAQTGNKMAGTSGHVGVFSFGCLKPIQGGEGGMITTNDDALARELRSLRHWGDRTIDFGKRDVTQLAWNGRMSEIVAAVVRAQLKGYPAYLKDLREQVFEFQLFLKNIDGFELVLGASQSIQDCAFTQVVLKIDEKKLRMKKNDLMREFSDRGISTWHANFEEITSLSFFKSDSWKEWILKGDMDRISSNYHQLFANSRKVYESTGLGLNKGCFSSSSKLNHLKRQIESVIAKI